MFLINTLEYTPSACTKIPWTRARTFFVVLQELQYSTKVYMGKLTLKANKRITYANKNPKNYENKRTRP